MSARRFRYLFAACLPFVVASCVDGRSPTIEPRDARRSGRRQHDAGDPADGVPSRAAEGSRLRLPERRRGHAAHRSGPGATAAVVATARGVRLSRDDDGGLELGVETTSVGRDGAARSRAVLGRRAEGQELVLDRDDDVEERYLAGPLGLEQSWVVRERPAGSGPLAIEVAFEGLAPEIAGGRGAAARRGGPREGRLPRSRGRRRRGPGAARRGWRRVREAWRW